MAKIDFDFDKEFKRMSQEERQKKTKPVSNLPKKNTLLIIAFSVVVIFILFLFFKSKPSDQTTPAQSKQNTTETQSNAISSEIINKPDVKTTDSISTTSLIKKVKIIPTNPTITDSIKAEVEFTNPQDSRDYNLKYQWFINNTNQIIGADTDTLQPGKVKKGDYVNVRVLAFKDDKIVQQINSDMYIICLLYTS
ncbi:MAG: hypothetical protein N2738_04080, partial [Thermodesulfovibrionales bacterium]|nr:hypothetical protein [Thermodesulfovibrionales bacterium]